MRQKEREGDKNVENQERQRVWLVRQTEREREREILCECVRAPCVSIPRRGSKGGGFSPTIKRFWFPTVEREFTSHWKWKHISMAE